MDYSKWIMLENGCWLKTLHRVVSYSSSAIHAHFWPAKPFIRVTGTSGIAMKIGFTTVPTMVPGKPLWPCEPRLVFAVHPPPVGCPSPITGSPRITNGHSCCMMVFYHQSNVVTALATSICALVSDWCLLLVMVGCYCLSTSFWNSILRITGGGTTTVGAGSTHQRDRHLPP